MEKILFNSTYFFADLVESPIYAGSGFWNYSEDIFIERALRFNKETLLHHYIETTIWNYYNKNIRKYGGDYIHYIFFFKSLLEAYNVASIFFDRIGDDEESTDEDVLNKLNKNFERKWHQYESDFRKLFNKIAKDVFYIYFGNRNLLLCFNKIVADTVAETVFQKECLTQKGLIKRKHIPQWVKKAVFSRDKGRCNKCTRDLTGLIAVDQKQHYDHIVPLNLSGANDPSNIQLLCEKCNLKKSGNIIETSQLYLKWWN
jgi:hypothetical protein